MFCECVYRAIIEVYKACQLRFEKSKNVSFWEGGKVRGGGFTSSIGTRILVRRTFVRQGPFRTLDRQTIWPPL